MNKLGSVRTYFSLLKGFICSGILYLPQSMASGGWLFSAFAMAFSYIFTVLCMNLLINVRKKIVGGASYVAIGEHCYGNRGKYLVEVFLFVS